MFNKLHVVLLVLTLVTTPIFGQDADTTDFEEEGGNEMFTSVDRVILRIRGILTFYPCITDLALVYLVI